MTSAIANSVVDSANILKAKAIIAATISGKTATSISALRPESVIIATCPNLKTAYTLALNFGVYSRIVPIFDTTDEVIEASKNSAKNYLSLETGDKVVIAGGFPRNSQTNFMKIEEID